MNGRSAWVGIYRVLAIIGCAILVIASIVGGVNASKYLGTPFIVYAGVGLVIAAAELVVSMMLCEFLDNVCAIRERVSKLPTGKDLDELLRAARPAPAPAAARVSAPAPASAPAAARSEVRPPRPMDPGAQQAQLTRKAPPKAAAVEKVVPKPARGGKIICPKCGTEQRAGSSCVMCRVPFFTEND